MANCSHSIDTVVVAKALTVYSKLRKGKLSAKIHKLVTGFRRRVCGSERSKNSVDGFEYGSYVFEKHYNIDVALR